MQAKDVMTTPVVTVTPDTPVAEVARTLLERRISGVPVVDAGGRLVGIVTEGDLLRRPELGTERHRGWWLRLFGDQLKAAEVYAKSHGTRAEEVMTRNVVSVAEDTSLGDIAQLLESHRIKRVPVLREGQLVGIVSRANLLHALAAGSAKAAPVRVDDRTLRAEIVRRLDRAEWVTHGPMNVIVTEGVVELWGFVESEAEQNALRVAVENVPGVVAVKTHFGTVKPWVWGA
jgi:CBS domain-containing protein